MNCDTDKDGRCDLNCDIDKDGKCDLNCDTNKDGKCDLNCDTNKDGKCDLNCDTNGDGKCDLNCDTNNDGRCDLNCDTDKDGKCDLNCDTNNDGRCDLNCDTDKDGKCDLNCDTDKDGKCDLNCDTDNDGKCDLNCDTNGDGICDSECDTDGDGKCDKNCSDVVIDDEKGTFRIYFLDDTTINYSSVRPGWKASKTFSIKNGTTKTLKYDIYWKDIINNFTKENNLYFELSRDGKVILDNTNRVPYPSNGSNDKVLLKDVEIKTVETHVYTLTVYFKETNKNQDMDRGKEFSSKLEVVNKGIKGE